MKTLDSIKINKTVTIKEIKCRDKLERRFLDLGLIPGTQITPVFSSIFKDPTAYLFRGTVLAIRAEDSCLIYVE